MMPILSIHGSKVEKLHEINSITDLDGTSVRPWEFVRSLLRLGLECRIRRR